MPRSITNNLSGRFEKNNQRNLTKRKKRRRSQFEVHLDRSFAAYKRMRREWLAKGYKLVPQMKKNEYRLNYKLAVDAGEKNIARTFAANDRILTGKEARKIKRSVKERKKEIEKKKEKLKSEIESLEEKEKRTSKQQERLDNSRNELESLSDEEESILEFEEEFPSIEDLLQMDLSPADLFERLVKIKTKKGDIFGSGWMTREEYESYFGY